MRHIVHADHNRFPAVGNRLYLASTDLVLVLNTKTTCGAVAMLLYAFGVGTEAIAKTFPLPIFDFVETITTPSWKVSRLKSHVSVLPL